jgi:uncharacterized membrane protein
MILFAAVLAAWPASAQYGNGPGAISTAQPTVAASIPPDMQTFEFMACNQSIDTVLISVSYFEGKTETTQGWWNVQKGDCLDLGIFPLDHKAFGIYADVRGGLASPEAKVWGGPDKYCINLGAAFTLRNAARKGNGLCPEAYSTRGFILVTPETLFPKDTERQNQQNIAFKYTFR